MTTYVSVAGAGRASADLEALAEDVGRRLAQAGAVVVTGGLGGVMDAASRGAAAAGGLVLAIVPGASRDGATPHATLIAASGAGEARNLAVAASGDGLIAVGGEWGTLSEIALARKLGRPVVTLAGHAVPGIEEAAGAEAAVRRILELVAAQPGRSPAG